MDHGCLKSGQGHWLRKIGTSREGIGARIQAESLGNAGPWFSRPIELSDEKDNLLAQWKNYIWTWQLDAVRREPLP
jgi:hypothetical protein